MTRSLDRLIEEYLRALIIAEISNEDIQVATSLMGAGEAAATYPRIVVKCESQDTPELWETGVMRIVTQIASIAESTNEISSDHLEEMNQAVDRVVIFKDNIPAALSTTNVLTYGVVYGGESQQINGIQLIRVRNAEIWAKLRDQPPFLTP